MTVSCTEVGNYICVVWNILNIPQQKHNPCLKGWRGGLRLRRHKSLSLIQSQILIFNVTKLPLLFITLLTIYRSSSPYWFCRDVIFKEYLYKSWRKAFYWDIWYWHFLSSCGLVKMSQGLFKYILDLILNKFCLLKQVFIICLLFNHFLTVKDNVTF